MVDLEKRYLPLLCWWIRWAEESIDLACKWAYEGVEAGITLSGKPNQSNLFK